MTSIVPIAIVGVLSVVVFVTVALVAYFLYTKSKSDKEKATSKAKLVAAEASKVSNTATKKPEEPVPSYWACALKSNGKIRGSVNDKRMCDSWVSACGNEGGCNAIPGCIGACSSSNGTRTSWGCSLKSTGEFVSDISDPLRCDEWVSKCGDGGGCKVF